MGRADKASKMQPGCNFTTSLATVASERLSVHLGHIVMWLRHMVSQDPG